MKAIEILHDIFKQKQEVNPSYSLRSLAKKSQISHAYLSLLFNQKKQLSRDSALKLIAALRPNSLQYLNIKNQLANEGISIESRKIDISEENLLKIEEFNLLSKWYYLVIMELTAVDDFVNDEAWIANKIGIDVLDVRLAILKLKKHGYLSSLGGELVKTKKHLVLQTSDAARVTKNYHQNMLSLAKQELEHQNKESFDERYMTGYTLPASPKNIEIIKQKMRETVSEIIELLRDSEPTEVYQMNFQLFPMSRTPQRLEKLNSDQSIRESRQNQVSLP